MLLDNLTIVYHEVAGKVAPTTMGTEDSTNCASNKETNEEEVRQMAPSLLCQICGRLCYSSTRQIHQTTTCFQMNKRYIRGTILKPAGQEVWRQRWNNNLNC